MEEKFEYYGQSLVLVLVLVQLQSLVPVTEPGTGSGNGAKFSSGLVLVER